MKPKRNLAATSETFQIAKDLFQGINAKVLILLLIILILAIYGNSLIGEFLLDDEFQIVNNMHIRKGTVADIFKHSLFFGREEVGFYRPLQGITIKSDYFFWGLDPIGFHITNIFLHTAVVICMFLLVLRMTSGNRFLSFFVSALYGAHPMHTSAVAYISGRADVLAFLFLLMMMLFWLPSSTGKGSERIRYAFAYCLFLCAILSKPLSLFFPAFLLLYEYIFSDKERYSKIIFAKLVKYIPFVLIALLYYAWVHNMFPIESLQKGTSTISGRIQIFLRVFYDYVTMLLYPLVHRMDWKYPVSYLTKEMILFCGAVLISFSIFCYFLWRKGKAGAYYRIIFFGLFWFLFALIPQSNIFITQNAPIAEHWLYIPAFGFVLFFACGSLRLLGKYWQSIGFVLFISIIFSFSVLTVKQNMHWRDEYSLFNYIIDVNPRSGLAHNNMAVILYERGERENAYTHFKKAAQLEPYNEKYTRNYQRIKMELNR